MGFVFPAYVKMQPVLGPKNKHPSASSAVTNDSWTVTAGVIKRGRHPGWGNKGKPLPRHCFAFMPRGANVSEPRLTSAKVIFFIEYIYDGTLKRICRSSKSNLKVSVRASTDDWKSEVSSWGSSTATDWLWDEGPALRPLPTGLLTLKVSVSSSTTVHRYSTKPVS